MLISTKMENENFKDAFNFELNINNEPLFSNDVLNFVTDYHKKTSIDIEIFIENKTNNFKSDRFLKLVSEIEFAFDELNNQINLKETQLINSKEYGIKESRKREKLQSNFERLNNSKLNWQSRVKEYFKEYLSENNNETTFETSTKETINPFPEIFKGFDNKNYLLFKIYTEKHIIDKYADYSFIIQKMKKDNSRILKQLTHLEIMEWLNENHFINDKDYEIFISKGSFATQYLNKADRINNYNLILKELFPNSFD